MQEALQMIPHRVSVRGFPVLKTQAYCRKSLGQRCSAHACEFPKAINVSHALNRRQRTAARFGQRCPANEFKAVTTPDSQIFRLNGQHRMNIRQIEDSNQTGFPFADFAPGFR